MKVFLENSKGVWDNGGSYLLDIKAFVPSYSYNEYTKIIIKKLNATYKGNVYKYVIKMLIIRS